MGFNVVSLFGPGCENCEFRGDVPLGSLLPRSCEIPADFTSANTPSRIMYDPEIKQSNAMVNPEQLDKAPDAQLIANSIARCKGFGECALSDAGLVPFELSPEAKENVTRVIIRTSTGRELEQ